MEYKRPSWDEYFQEIRESVAKRATCDRGRSGCVIVKNKQILATGYVGSPAGLPHCDEIGHLMKEIIHDDGTKTKHCMRTAHAEMNAITNAARNGVQIEGATLYCLMTPCRTCAMAIINAGIKRVHCIRKYHAGKESEEMFEHVGIELIYMEDKLQEYSNQ